VASPAPVGVVGLGLMGEVYARRLIAAGFAVTGFDVDAVKIGRLETIGAQGGSLADIARGCEPIVLAVFDTDQVEGVVAAARASKETVVIDFRVEQEDSVYPMVAAGADLHDMIRRPSPIVETAED